LNKLNVSKTPGPDLVHPRIIYEVRHEITYPLTKIFNKSLQSKQLPLDWKRANISPIFKKGKKCEVNNYRPVSLTCIACKILERIIRDTLMTHFINNKFFSTKQFGFLKGRSTVTQLLKILDDWTEQLESGGRVDVIYTDLEKAFDKVPHQRLISKLRSYGVHKDVIDWITAFLTGRQE
jgi:hypothetical protein